MKTGTVKFFNRTKGFGFITPDEGGKDVFVHVTGTNHPISDNDRVSYELKETDRGPSAVNVDKAD